MTDLKSMSVDELREYAAERMGSGYWEEAFDELAQRLAAAQRCPGEIAEIIAILRGSNRSNPDYGRGWNDALDSVLANVFQASLLRQVAETMGEGWVSIEAAHLLAIRDHLVKEDESEAYHQLYMAAHENADNKFQPWNEWEAAMLAVRPKEKE